MQGRDKTFGIHRAECGNQRPDPASFSSDSVFIVIPLPVPDEVDRIGDDDAIIAVHLADQP